MSDDYEALADGLREHLATNLCKEALLYGIPITLTEKAWRECARLTAENDALREALEAADSLVKSYTDGGLDGWEMELYKRRRQALRATDSDGGGE